MESNITIRLTLFFFFLNYKATFSHGFMNGPSDPLVWASSKLGYTSSLVNLCWSSIDLRMRCLCRSLKIFLAKRKFWEGILNSSLRLNTWKGKCVWAISIGKITPSSHTKTESVNRYYNYNESYQIILRGI